jgi:hypothetical protein
MAACAQAGVDDGSIPPIISADASSKTLDSGSNNTFDASWGTDEGSATDLGPDAGPDTKGPSNLPKDGFDGTADAGTDLSLGGGGGPCDLDVPPSAQLGAPGLYFEPWSEGATIPLSLGSEGGVSVRFNLATWGLPEIIISLYSAVYAGEQKIAEWTASSVIFACQEDGSHLLVQYSINLSPDSDIFSLLDQAGRVEVRLEFEGLSIETNHNGSFELDL